MDAHNAEYVLTDSERMRLAGAVYSHTSHRPPLGAHDLSSVLNPVERMVEQIVRERMAHERDD